MYTALIILLLGVIDHAESASNYEVNLLMNKFSAVSRKAKEHEPDVTPDDISAFRDIKKTITELIDRHIMTPTGQTYPWYAGMHLEFYKCATGNTYDKEFVVLPATSRPMSRVINGAPPDWAYDEEDRRYFDLRDGNKPVAQIYFKI